MNWFKSIFNKTTTADTGTTPTRIVSSTDRFSRDPIVKCLVDAYRTNIYYGIPEKEKEKAQNILKGAGPEAVPVIIQALDQLHFDAREDKYSQEEHPFLKISVTSYVRYLIGILLEIGDERAVDILLRHFAFDAESAGSLADKISQFCTRIGTKKATTALIEYLDDDLTRLRAVYGLGLLADDRATNMLMSALEKYGDDVRSQLKYSKTSFAEGLIAQWERKRKESGLRVESMRDAEMIKILKKLCKAYMDNDKETITYNEPIARDIGEELDRRGGLVEMRRVFALLNGCPGSRTLEMHWHRIGQWMG